MKRNRKKILLSALGGMSLGLVGKTLYDYVREQPEQSKESWLLDRIFALLSWPANQFESELLYETFIRLVENSSEKYIRVPRIQSVTVSEVLINDMQTVILNNKRDPHQKVIFFTHGGAYLAQPTLPHFNTALDIVRQTDAKVVMPIYPKAPVYNYKDAYPRLLEAYRLVLLHTSSPENISFMGDSAGGALVAGLSSLLIHEGHPLPKRLILISPWLDAGSENPNIKKFEATDTLLPNQVYFKETGLLWAGNEENLYDPLVSPLYSSYLQDLPPTYIIAGGDEMLYPDIVRFEELMQEAGGAIELFVKDNMVHDYTIFNTPEGREARELISQLILETEEGEDMGEQ